MKKIILAAICITFSQLSYSQSTDSLSNSDNNQSKYAKKTKTLKINTSGYSLNMFGELKDELIVWTSKVNRIDIDEKNKEFILIHNQLMDTRELFEVLNKYGIKKSSILSYE